CWVSGFPLGTGILVTQSGAIDVELRNVTANDNGKGLETLPTSGPTMTILVTDSQFNGNSENGIVVNGPVKATFDNVTAAANGAQGVSVDGRLGGSIVAMITGSKLVNNMGAGLSAIDTNNQVFVDRTQISGNGANGWETVGGAVVNSYLNNEV